MNISIHTDGKSYYYGNARKCWIVKGEIQFKFLENGKPMIMGYDIDKCDSININEKDWNGYDWTFDERHRGSEIKKEVR